MRLIDADELINKLNKFESDVHGSAECYSSVTEITEAIEYVGILIDDAPTVEAVSVEAICDDLLGRYKRAHGEWIGVDHDMYFKCSNCGYLTDYMLTNFCPECGTDMRKKV